MCRSLSNETVTRANPAMMRQTMLMAWCLWSLLGCGETLENNERSHVLERPLLVQGKTASSVGVLPAGTRLYYERSFAEGFDLFHLYVRIEGGEMKLTPLDRPGLIDPLGVGWAAPGRSGEDHRRVEPSELRAVLDALGAGRQDVEALLRTYDHSDTP